MTTTEARPTDAATAERPWSRAMVVLAAALVLWALAFNLLAGFIPPVAVLGLLFLASIFVVRRWPRKAGPIFLLVVTVANFLGGAPFMAEALPHPESPVDFLMSAVIPVTISAGIVVAVIGALRRRSWPGARRAVAFGVPAVIVALVAVSVAAATSLEDDVAAAQDAQLVAEEIEFAPDAFLADAGTVGVFIDNQDPIRHNFSIEELGVDLEIPASTDRRVEFQADPGTYRFFCKITGHEDMEGELVVGG